MDNTNDFGGRGRARRTAKRTARKSTSLKGKDKRRYIRKAGQTVKAQQVLKKAQTKSGKRKEHLIKKASKIQSLQGRSRIAQSAMTVALAPLLPFKKAMEKALRSKGSYTGAMTFPMLTSHVK